MQKKINFLKTTIIVFIVLFCSNISNYLFNIFLARNVTEVTFGIISKINNLSMMILAAFVVFPLFYIKVIHESSNNDNNTKIISNLSFIMFILFILKLFILVFFYPFILNYIGSQYNDVVIVFVIYNLFLLINLFFYSIFQYEQRYFLANLIGSFFLILKLILIFLYYLLEIKFSIFNINFINLLSSIIIFIIFLTFFDKSKFIFLKPTYKEILYFAKKYFLFFLSISSLTLLVSLDIFIVSFITTENELGVYAAISMVSKIIYYSNTLLVTTLYPETVVKQKINDNPFRIFYTTLILVSLLTSGFYLFFYLFGEIFIKYTFGLNYISSLDYFYYCSLYFVILSLINIFTHFNLGIGKFVLPMFQFVIFIPIIFFVYFFGSNIINILKIMNLSIFGFLILYFFYFFLNFKRSFS